MLRSSLSAMHKTYKSAISNTRSIGIQCPNGGSYDYDYYVSLLKECGKMKTVAKGKQVHSHMLKSGVDENGFVGSQLMNMYVKCGIMDDACLVFDTILNPNLFCWTSIIGGYAKHGYFQETLMLFSQMQQTAIQPDNFIFPSVLKACSGLSSLQQGKQIHAYLIRRGIESDVFVASSLVDMYAKCGSVGFARQLFEKISERDVVSWVAMIAGYAQNGHDCEALEVFCEMQHGGVKPNLITIVSILPACARISDLDHGKEIHNYVKRSGFDSDVFVGSALVDMYAKCGSIENARRVFDEIPERDVVSWNTMVAGYSQNGNEDEALKLFHLMQLANMNPDNVTIASILLTCANLASLQHGKEIHGYIIRGGFDSDAFVMNSLIDMYRKCGSLVYAQHVFGKIPQNDVVSWNTMITCYAQSGYSDEAIKLFTQMQLVGMQPNIVTWNAIMVAYAQNGDCNEALECFHEMQIAGVNPDMISWNTLIAGYARNGKSFQALEFFRQMYIAGMKANSITIVSILSACAQVVALQEGREIHCFIFRNGYDLDVFVGSALVDMYAKCKRVDTARRVFDKLLERDGVSWNTMIASYAQNGHVNEAQELFDKMEVAGIKPDIMAWNAIIAGYAQNGHGGTAFRLFGEMQLSGIQPNVITWNGMIAGYTQNGHGYEALKLFLQMQHAGAKADSGTFASVLPACTCIAALHWGQEIHTRILLSDFESDTCVMNAVIDMYAKCGSIKDARQAFDRLSGRDTVSWNAIISGYAAHGHGEDVITLFHQMQLEEVKPDYITFTGVLSACSHVGMVDQGWQYFYSMSQQYGIKPRVEHYACIVDLLGRAGSLDAAYDFINKMPLQPSPSVWGALLAACRIHDNLELGEYAAEQLFQLEPDNIGIYVLLSNIYASAGRWDQVTKLRKLLKDRGLKKRPGCSWIEVNNSLHAFQVGDNSHSAKEKIYSVGELEWVDKGSRVYV